jgi:hypothetical protein
MASDENLRGKRTYQSFADAKRYDRTILRHVAGGGSMSSGVISSVAAGSSTFDLRSAALSISAAEILGSLVALAIPNRIAA